MAYKTNMQLEQENFQLRRRLSYYKSQFTLAVLERDAARVALQNYNMTEAWKEIERSYKK